LFPFDQKTSPQFVVVEVEAAYTVLVHHSISDVRANLSFLSLFDYSSIKLDIAIVEVVNVASILLMGEGNNLLLNSLSNFFNSKIFASKLTQIFSSKVSKRVGILS